MKIKNQGFKAVQPLYVFLAILTVLSVVCNFFLANEGSIRSSKGHILVITMMFIPTISYVITKVIFKNKVDNIRFKIKRLTYALQAYTLPFIYVTVAYFIVWLCGFYNDTFGWLLLLSGILATLINVLVVIGEEIGWRGFLLNELSKRISPLKAAIIVGFIWSTWHIPGLIFTDYSSTSNLLIGIPSFIISLTMLSIPMAFYVFKSKSIIPAILMHASHNALIQTLYEPMSVQTPYSDLLKDETGLIFMLVSAVVGVYFGFKLKEINIKNLVS